ncbi:MAG: paraquat-inducible protein A [Allorhizobium sp.]
MIWVKSVLLMLAPLCLGLGLVLPLVRFEKLYFFTDSPSLIGIIVSLWRDGDGALAALVGLFSVIFPAVKLIGLMAEWLAAGRDGSGKLGWIVPLLSKWSMMDVMLVAIVIFAAKTSGLANAFTQPGLWFYTASALLAGVLQAMLRRPPDRFAGRP